MSQSLPGLHGEVLTDRRFYRNLNFPNYYRRSRRLCHAPHGKKSGLFRFLPPVRPWSGVGYILARRRPGVREAPAAVVGRGASSCLFLCPTPTTTRCIMSNRPLSLWYPVWNHLHESDPFMASVRAILRANHEPEMEAALIGTVFHMAQTENRFAYAEASARREVEREVRA